MGMNSSKDEEIATPPKIGAHKRIVDLEFDPRSPSVEISRTPIVVEKTPEGVLDPRSPSVGIIRTPITSLGGETSGDLTPLMLEMADENEDEEDLTDTDRLLLEIQEMPEVQTLCIKDDNKGKNNINIHTDVEKAIRKKPIKIPQPKQLFPAHSRLTNEKKDLTRSPLSTRTVDMNSPRVIVQRKQTKKLEKSCALEHVRNREGTQDKENIHH